MLFSKSIYRRIGYRTAWAIQFLLLAITSGYSQPGDTARRSPVFNLQLMMEAMPDTSHRDIYKNVISSLNNRKLLLHRISRPDTGFTSFLRSTLQSTPLAGMKDSVMDEFFYYVKNNFGIDRVNKVIKNYAAAGDSLALSRFVGSKIRGFYSISGMESLNIPAFDRLLKNRLNTVSYAVVHDNSGMSPLPWMHQVQVQDEAMLMDIPFQIGFSNLSNDATPLTYNNLVKLSFDKDAFQKGLHRKLGKYYDMQKYLLADMDVVSYVKKHFESELSQKLKQSANEIIPDPGRMLGGRLSYDELLKLDMEQIKAKMMPPGEMQAIRNRIMAWETLVKDQGATLSARQKDSLLKKIADQSNYLASLTQITGAIQQVKNKLDASGINVNRVERLQQTVNAKVAGSLQRPEVIKEASEALLPMSGLQRFFTKVQSLQAGTFGMQQSDRTISALIRGGAHLSFLKNSNLFSGGLGQLKDGGLLKDAGLTNSLFSTASFMQFLQFGKERKGGNETRFSVVNSNARTVQSALFNQLALPRNVLAATVSKTVRVRRSGIVEAEFSKSATQYRNTMGSGADMLMEQKSALLGYGDDFWQTLSAGIRYADDWEKIGLSHNARVSYAGFGYNNPGNPGASKGSWQYDLQLRKDLLQRKGTVQAQFANRQYNYAANTGHRWNNVQFNIHGRYRFGRQLTLGARYNQYQLVRKEEEVRRNMYVSRKLAADAQLSGMIGGMPQRSHFSLGWQQFDNVTVQQGGNSNLLLVQWLSTVAMGNVAVTGNVFYNKEISDYALIGDLLTVELGAAYTVKKRVTLNSAFTYLDNNIAARQLGIRQSVNTTFWKNWSVSVYLDCRKNLITPVNEYLYGSFRGELSVHYLIN